MTLHEIRAEIMDVKEEIEKLDARHASVSGEIDLINLQREMLIEKVKILKKELKEV